jgi:hypothetical protein
VTTARSVSVTDGRRTIGSVIERDDGFQALDLEGRVVGIFRSEPAAANAVFRAAENESAS